MNIADLQRAIDLALAGLWEESHRLVQHYDDEYAAWVHAVLHKIEGDMSNSRYWYARTSRSFDASISTSEELRTIQLELTRLAESGI